ncbi:MAG: DUF2029 domain-containing protein [Planctomycetes bacterium]|nr:DUF2029 domain-containing protein [Planctomycetota bacterium]
MNVARWLTTRNVGFAVFVVAAGIAAKNLLFGRYADFDIYLTVARELQAGGVDLCRARTESGPWVYPHCAALPFVLMLQVFGEFGARVAWCCLLGALAAWLVRSLHTAVSAAQELRVRHWLVFALLFQRCVAQNLTHGQLSLAVGAFTAAGVAALVRGRDGKAGVWLALAAALKVTPVLFVPALVVMGRWRAALVMAATLAFTVFVLPWPLLGTAEHLRHLHDTWHALTSSVVDPTQSAIVQSYAGPGVGGALDYLLQPRPLDAEGRTVNLFAVGDTTLTVVKAIWSLALAALLGLWFLRAKHLPLGPRVLHQACTVVLAMGWFAPLLRVYHLAAALPPFLLFCTGPRDRRDGLWWLAAGVVLFAMTLRQKNLLGEAAWRALDGGAFLHLGMVLVAVWLLRSVTQGPACPPPASTS